MVNFLFILGLKNAVDKKHRKKPKKKHAETLKLRISIFTFNEKVRRIKDKFM